MDKTSYFIKNVGLLNILKISILCVSLNLSVVFATEVEKEKIN